jgi:hypothetical protein
MIFDSDESICRCVNYLGGHIDPSENQELMAALVVFAGVGQRSTP